MSKRSLKSFSDVVDWGLCVGCGACAYASKTGDVRMVHVASEGYRPVFDAVSRPSADPLEICPGYQVNGDLKIGRSTKQTEAEHEFGATLEIWEGWASDSDIRFRASSGGLLSALAVYCLEAGGFKGVIHVGMDPEKPWMNRNYISRTRAEVLARAGSRYAPSAPCAALSDIAGDDGPYVFIGKPCDASAVSELCRRDPELNRRIGLILTFFCAGTPSTQGTLDLLSGLGVDQNRVKEVHYRGEGWPGDFRAISEGRVERKALSYQESWGRLTSYRPLRCNLCPDGLGRVADIACGDAWQRHENDGNPGRSLALVRTERGRELLNEARRLGYTTLAGAGAEDVLRAQTSLLNRRRALFGRLAAFRMLGVPMPSFKGFSLFHSWRATGLKAQARTVFGTLLRIVRRKWFRRRPSLLRTAADGTLRLHVVAPLIRNGAQTHD